MPYVRTQSRSRLTRKAVLLAKVESTFNTDASPDSTNAILVEEPSYEIDVTTLERNSLRDDISPLGVVTGRKLARMTFTVEVRSNGLTNSGDVNDEAELGRLLRGCGYSVTAITGTGTIGTVQPATTNTTNPTWAAGGASTKTANILYKLRCVLGGASATAKIRVTGYHPGEDTGYLPSEVFTGEVYNSAETPTGTVTVDESDPLAVDYTIAGTFNVGDKFVLTVGGVRFTHTVVSGDTDNDGIASALATLIDAHSLIAATTTANVINVTFTGNGAGAAITSGSTAIALGGSGATITPTWTGNLVIDDTWEVLVSPVGLQYDPVSSDFESLTLYAYLDGVLHKMTGCYGTFTMDAPAGEYAKATFTFTGSYFDPVERDAPSVTFDFDSLPPQVELSQLYLDDFQAIIAQFQYDQANDIVVRPDVNSSNGYYGTNITGRNPTGSVNPEATILSDYDFHYKLANSSYIKFQMRVGRTSGNRILLWGPNVQYTGVNYGDRDNIRAYDVGLKFAREYGNDEMSFHFS